MKMTFSALAERHCTPSPAAGSTGQSPAQRAISGLKRNLIVSAGLVSSLVALALILGLIAVLFGTSHSPAVAQQLSAAADVGYISEVSSAFDDGDPTGFGPSVGNFERLASEPRVVERVTAKGRIQNVNLTFYDCKSQGFCGNMYNGRKVYEGAAACSWNLPIGTRFTIVGDPTKRVYVCEDRGLLSNTWVDIFWNSPADGWKWQASVGRSGAIDVLELPGR